MGLVSVATGESKLDLISDLKQAYLDSFETAKTIFEGDPEMLRAWQDQVVAGLEGVKDSGRDAFQDLVDVQLQILGIQQGTQVTQESMDVHLASITAATRASLLILSRIAESSGAISTQTVTDLSTQLGILGLAHGGIVTKPTFAMIGEAGPEAVIPLSKSGQFGGGGATTINISFPNIRDFKDITVSEAERLLQGSFDRAMQNLNRVGHRLPIKAKT